jgi:hypothetical protein
MSDARKIWVTLTGLPLDISLEWPFHPSTSGADFWVLHGDLHIVGTELHALVSVNLSQTVREVLPSLEQKDAEAPVINALRKEVDRRQIEFAKSGKLLPVAFSSRHYDFKRARWVFGKASDEVIAGFVERKVYWETKSNIRPKPKEGLDEARARSGGDSGNQVPHRGSAPVRNDITSAHRVWIGDPAEAQYLESTPAHLIEVAGRLVAGDGLVRMEGEFAEATSALMGQAERFEAAARTALEELEKKHAFERG